jgi:hypothetical protein
MKLINLVFLFQLEIKVGSFKQKKPWFLQKTENKKMSLNKIQTYFKILIKFKTEVYTNVYFSMD